MRPSTTGREARDGPGYTDDRGVSTMPDNRDNLTVGELIGLVA